MRSRVSMRQNKGASALAVHGILAVLALGAAYMTWTRDKTQVQSDTVTVLDAAKRDIESVTYEDETRTVTVERKSSPTGEPYAWITSTSRQKSLLTNPMSPMPHGAMPGGPMPHGAMPGGPMPGGPAVAPVPSKGPAAVMPAKVPAVMPAKAAPGKAAPASAKGGDKAAADKDRGEKKPPMPASSPIQAAPPKGSTASAVVTPTGAGSAVVSPTGAARAVAKTGDVTATATTGAGPAAATSAATSVAATKPGGPAAMGAAAPASTGAAAGAAATKPSGPAVPLAGAPVGGPAVATPAPGAAMPASGTPATAEPAKPIHEVKETVVVKAFRGNEQADKLLDSFGPLQGLRALGNLDDTKLKELGLTESKKSLTLQVKGKPTKLMIGSAAYGSGDVYVRDPQGQVYLLPQRFSSDFEYADSRLMERRMHRFERPDLTKVEVTVGTKKRTLVQQKRQDPAGFYWALEGSPDKRDDSLKNWMDKVLRLAISDFVSKGDEPQQPAMSQPPGPSGVPQYGEVMTLRFFDGSKQIGEATFTRYPKGTQTEYYAKTETTIGLVRLLSQSAESVIQDAEKW